MQIVNHENIIIHFKFYSASTVYNFLSNYLHIFLDIFNPTYHKVSVKWLLVNFMYKKVKPLHAHTIK